jgi:hypothetical protein
MKLVARGSEFVLTRVYCDFRTLNLQNQVYEIPVGPTKLPYHALATNFRVRTNSLPFICASRKRFPISAVVERSVRKIPFDELRVTG